MFRIFFICFYVLNVSAHAEEPDPFTVRHPQTEEEKARVSAHLAQMMEADQAARKAINPHRKEPVHDAAWEAKWERILQNLQAIDAANYIHLNQYMQTYGWFPHSVWGENTAYKAWLLVQHMDHQPEFQARVLATMTTLIEQGEISERNYAYLYDRVARGRQTPQLYGTQGRCTGPDEWTPNPIEDEARVDERRENMGLEPLAEYQAQISRICVTDES